MDFLTSSTSFHLRLLGLAPAILVTPVNVLSGRVRHRLVSRRSRRLRIRKFVLPTRSWSFSYGAQSRRFGAQPKLSDSRLFFQRTLAALRTDPLQHGRYVHFNSSKASVMLVVQLATCVRSREQTTSARWEFFSTSLHLRSRLSLGWLCLEKTT